MHENTYTCINITNDRLPDTTRSHPIDTHRMKVTAGWKPSLSLNRDVLPGYFRRVVKRGGGEKRTGPLMNSFADIEKEL